MKSLIVLASIASVAFTSTSAQAQFNGSNSSGANVTSYSGTNSIWSGNPVQKLVPPVEYTPTKGITTVVIPTPQVQVLVKPVEYTPAKGITTVEDPGCPFPANGDSYLKPVYKPAIKKAPRARG